ncbi:MAG: hypothetical protein ACHQAZ_04200 [Gammaproteobacteria bacterium]
MTTQNDSNQIAFLQGTWRAVLHDQAEPFQKSLLLDFVSSDVISQLPEYTTLRNVLAECHSQGAFEESYIKSFLALRKSWRVLTSESRHTIIQYIQKCGLQKNNGLKLLEDDEAALTIRWDTANRLYAGACNMAFKACQVSGLEMLQPRGKPRHNEFRTLVRRGQETLVALLKERINIDKTAVTMAVGYVTPVAKTKIKNNLAAAYLDSLDAFRAALFHWSVHNLSAFTSLEIFKGTLPSGGLTTYEESAIKEYIEHALKSFKQEYEQLRAGVEDMPPDPTIYDKARRFFDSKPATLH